VYRDTSHTPLLLPPDTKYSHYIMPNRYPIALSSPRIRCFTTGNSQRETTFNTQPTASPTPSMNTFVTNSNRFIRHSRRITLCQLQLASYHAAVMFPTNGWFQNIPHLRTTAFRFVSDSSINRPHSSIFLQSQFPPIIPQYASIVHFLSLFSQTTSENTIIRLHTQLKFNFLFHH
jgi:hypothetical protein